MKILRSGFLKITCAMLVIHLHKMCFRLYTNKLTESSYITCLRGYLAYVVQLLCSLESNTTLLHFTH